MRKWKMSWHELKVKTCKLSAAQDTDDQVTIGLRFKTDFRDQFEQSKEQPKWPWITSTSQPKVMLPQNSLFTKQGYHKTPYF